MVLFIKTNKYWKARSILKITLYMIIQILVIYIICNYENTLQYILKEWINQKVLFDETFLTLIYIISSVQLTSFQQLIMFTIMVLPICLVIMMVLVGDVMVIEIKDLACKLLEEKNKNV